MPLYIKVSFWLGVIGTVIRLGELAVCEFPRKKTDTIGAHLTVLLIGAGLTVWAGFILFS